MLGREGCPVQCKQGAGKRQRGAQKGGSLSTHLKGSRLEQAHEIRPNVLCYNYDNWSFAITMTHPSPRIGTTDTDSDNMKLKPKNICGDEHVAETKTKRVSVFMIASPHILQPCL